MSGQEPVRLGLLGAGAITQVMHLPLLAQRDDVAIVALADEDRSKATSVAGRFGVERVLTDRELIESDCVDAVIVCTPNFLHEEHAISLLEAGKHVLVERPLALSGDGVARVLDAARASGMGLVAGMAHRYRPDVVALKSFVAGGELGPVYSVRGSLLHRKVALRRGTWRHNPSQSGGGALVDLGVPILDLCLWLVGYPKIARVSAVTLTGDYEVEDAAMILAETANGIALSIEVSWSLFAEGDQYEARVLGRAGSGWLPPLRVHKQLGGRPLEVTPDPLTRPENPYLTSYRRMLDRFVGTASGERAVELPTEQEQLLRVIEAAYRSAAEQHEVAI